MKRLFDISAASLALILLSPILLVLAILVSRELGSPVLFRQERIGLRGKPFFMIKFRTMTEQRGEDGNLLPDQFRLTRLGRFMRRTSLDELPELIHVLRGEMSLVGPRPLLPRYYPYFTEEERLRFTVRPGITGLAQVSGRNDLSWDQRMAADVRYVQEWSFVLDLRILLQTIGAVVGRRGVKEDPMATMIDFDEERRQKGYGPRA